MAGCRPGRRRDRQNDSQERLVSFVAQYKTILQSVNNRQFSCGIFTIQDGNRYSRRPQLQIRLPHEGRVESELDQPTLQRMPSRDTDHECEANISNRACAGNQTHEAIIVHPAEVARTRCKLSVGQVQNRPKTGAGVSKSWRLSVFDRHHLQLWCNFHLSAWPIAAAQSGTVQSSLFDAA